MNVAVGEELERLTFAGVKVPPPPLEENATLTFPEMVPLAPTVKVPELALTAPEVGPVKVSAVAGIIFAALQLVVVPPFEPVQSQVKDVVLDETAVAVPEVHKLAVGALLNDPPLLVPQTPESAVGVGLGFVVVLPPVISLF